MSYQYCDEIAKLKYYKDRIIQLAISDGVYPSEAAIATKLHDIDLKLAIFDYKNAAKGSTFDTDKFNQDFLFILADLQILYKLVYEQSIKKYEECVSYVNVHLEELESIANSYEQKSKFEIGSTYLGKTLLFQASDFNRKSSEDSVTFTLKNFKVQRGSKIACLVDSDSIEPKNVLFVIGGKSCSPYNYNKDTITITGSPVYNEYQCNIDKDVVIKQIPEMTANKLIPDSTSNYIIFGGKDSIKLTIDNEPSFISSTNHTYSSKTGGNVFFYIIGGHYARFTSSITPTNKNFEGYTIETPAAIQSVSISFDNAFELDIDTDGAVYASKEKGVVNSSKLYYPAVTDMHDYLIREYTEKDNIMEFTGFMKIYNLNAMAPLINSIAIKELSNGVSDS